MVKMSVVIMAMGQISLALMPVAQMEMGLLSMGQITVPLMVWALMRSFPPESHTRVGIISKELKPQKVIVLICHVAEFISLTQDIRSNKICHQIK